jgi:hypothetical protein
VGQRYKGRARGVYFVLASAAASARRATASLR